MRHCPSCDAQFPDEQQSCLHCGGALEEDSAEGLLLLASLDPFESRPLLERLTERGIPFAVLNDQLARARAVGRGRPGSFAGVNIFVRQDDHPSALEIHQQIVRDSLPDLPPDYAPENTHGDGCPACGAELAADAPSCAECGLEFPDATA
jgi:hypothetical protein